MIRLSVVTALCLSPQLATADKAAGKREYAGGKQAYAAGDYLQAAQKFEAAYTQDPDPAYVFNVGQAYRRRAEQKSGNVEQDCFRSLDAYQRFLQQVPSPPNRKEVDAYIREMKECAGDYRPPEPIDKPPSEPIDKPIDRPIDKPPSEPPSKTDPKRWVGIGIGVVGAAAVGLGLYYAKDSADIRDQRDATLDPDLREELDRDGKRANKRAYIFGIGGGVALLGGAALFILGSRDEQPQRLTIVPTRDGAAVIGSFRF